METNNRIKHTTPCFFLITQTAHAHTHTNSRTDAQAYMCPLADLLSLHHAPTPKKTHRRCEVAVTLPNDIQCGRVLQYGPGLIGNSGRPVYINAPSTGPNEPGEGRFSRAEPPETFALHAFTSTQAMPPACTCATLLA